MKKPKLVTNKNTQKPTGHRKKTKRRAKKKPSCGKSWVFWQMATLLHTFAPYIGLARARARGLGRRTLIVTCTNTHITRCLNIMHNVANAHTASFNCNIKIS